MPSTAGPRAIAVVFCAVVAALVLTAPPAASQTVLERSPNVSGGWTGRTGQAYFTIVHRFRNTGPPERNISAEPTFLLAGGLPFGALVGVKYATNSDIVSRIPNEWELFGRYAPFTQRGGAPLDLSVEAAYNAAARSIDGELGLGRRIGPVRLLLAARAFSNAYDRESPLVAAAAGATVRLRSGIALAADVGSPFDSASAPLAWSAGLQLGIPYTPHTLSIHAANTNTATLQGSSRGSDRVRYGFEFTVPITFDRYRSGREPPVAAAEPEAPAFASENAVTVDIEALAYASERLEIPVGTTVTWTNRDAVMHTVTADDGAWDSGAIAPGETWSRSFDDPGEVAYHCTPHPFMTAEIVVVPAGADGDAR